MEEIDVNDEEEEEEMLAHITSISTQPYRLSRARCQRDLRYNKMTLATKFMRSNVKMAVRSLAKPDLGLEEEEEMLGHTTSILTQAHRLDRVRCPREPW
jgi:hypothetical protein